MSAENGGHRPPLQSSEHAGMAHSISSRLRIHAQAVRSVPYRYARDKVAVCCVDCVYLRVETAGEPQHFAVGRHATHIGTSAAGQYPLLHNIACRKVNERHAALLTV